MNTLYEENFEMGIMDTANNVSIVKFGADWCAPCKVVHKSLENLEKLFGDVNFYEVDADTNPELTKTFSVRGLPTILYFKDGEVVDRTTGAITERAIQDRIESLLEIS